MKYRQTRLESRGRRLGRILRHLFKPGYVKQQRAYLVEIGDTSVKRLVVEDSRIAQRIAADLRAFEDHATVPNVVACFKNEVWVEYLDGRPVEASDPHAAAGLASMFASVCSNAASQQDPRDLGFDRELRENLHFLGRTGLLDQATSTDLLRTAERALPDRIWVGHDYTDPRPSNFLWNDNGELAIIDVESLVSNRLIGCGAAKALVSWMAPQREAFLAELQRTDAPDFLSTFSYVELYFLARWQKRSVLHRKPWLLNPALFDRFRQYDSATDLK